MSVHSLNSGTDNEKTDLHKSTVTTSTGGPQPNEKHHGRVLALDQVDVAAELDSEKPLDPAEALRLRCVHIASSSVPKIQCVLYVYRRKIDWHLMPLMCSELPISSYPYTRQPTQSLPSLVPVCPASSASHAARTSAIVTRIKPSLTAPLHYRQDDIRRQDDPRTECRSGYNVRTFSLTIFYASWNF
jgi:hypothetical protein